MSSRGVAVYAYGSERIYLKRDPRGESENYTAYMLVGYRSGRRVWTEGLRKDRENMWPDIREAVERLLKG